LAARDRKMYDVAEGKLNAFEGSKVILFWFKFKEMDAAEGK